MWGFVVLEAVEIMGAQGRHRDEQEYITLEAKTVADGEVGVIGLQRPACQPGHFRTGESQEQRPLHEETQRSRAIIS